MSTSKNIGELFPGIHSYNLLKFLDVVWGQVSIKLEPVNLIDHPNSTAVVSDDSNSRAAQQDTGYESSDGRTRSPRRLPLLSVQDIPEPRIPSV